MDNFEIEIICKKCGSTDVHICKHLDFTGELNGAVDYTNNIVLVCQNKKCRNRELIILKYQIVY